MRHLWQRMRTHFQDSGERQRFGKLLLEVDRPWEAGSAEEEIDAIFSGARTYDDALSDFTALLSQRKGIAIVFAEAGVEAADERIACLKDLYLGIRVAVGTELVGSVSVAMRAICSPAIITQLLKYRECGMHNRELGEMARRLVLAERPAPLV